MKRDESPKERSPDKKRALSDETSPQSKPNSDSRGWWTFISNDNVHTVEQAVNTLIEVTGMSFLEALMTAKFAHDTGEAPVIGKVTHSEAMRVCMMLRDSGFGSRIEER